MMNIWIFFEKESKISLKLDAYILYTVLREGYCECLPVNSVFLTSFPLSDGRTLVQGGGIPAVSACYETHLDVVGAIGHPHTRTATVGRAGRSPDSLWIDGAVRNRPESGIRMRLIQFDLSRKRVVLTFFLRLGNAAHFAKQLAGHASGLSAPFWMWTGDLPATRHWCAVRRAVRSSLCSPA
jgi:hypothetical protein